jgi:hypothetical protein
LSGPAALLVSAVSIAGLELLLRAANQGERPGGYVSAIPLGGIRLRLLLLFLPGAPAAPRRFTALATRFDDLKGKRVPLFSARFTPRVRNRLKFG